jgi:hypothetical protein
VEQHVNLSTIRVCAPALGGNPARLTPTALQCKGTILEGLFGGDDIKLAAQFVAVRECWFEEIPRP